MHVCTAADTESGIVTTENESTMDRNLIPSILVPVLVFIIIVVMLSFISVWRKRYIILMDRRRGTLFIHGPKHVWNGTVSQAIIIIMMKKRIIIL